MWRLRTFVAQTVTIGEQKVCPESELLKFSTTPTPQVENPSDSDSSTPTPQPWGTLLQFLQGRQEKTSRLTLWKRAHGLSQLYVSFFFAVLNSSTQNIQVPKNQTHYTYSLCSGRKDRGCKNLARTSKTRQVKQPKRLQLLGSRFDCLLLSPLQRIERNETVARRNVKFDFPCAVIIEIRVKIKSYNHRVKSGWTEHSKQLKWFSPGLHNKII